MQGSFRLQNETGSNLTLNVRGVHYELFHWVQFRSIQPMKQSFTNDSGVLLCRTLNCRLLLSRCDILYHAQKVQHITKGINISVPAADEIEYCR